jgi:hypothetical protein
MSTETQERPTDDAMQGTKPIREHEWLKNLIGEWKTDCEMSMGPDQPTQRSTGTESVKSLGGLWAFGQGTGTMPDGSTMEYKTGLGYDVSFKEYRAFMIMSASSHLWKYTGTLSADGKTMTLDCVGPDMEVDGKAANYRDVIQIIDENHRTLTSSGEGKNGEWQQWMKVSYTRV